MGLNLNDKKAVVAEVAAQVASAQTIAIAEYRGIEVGDLTVLRKKARESGVYLRVLKNTLVRRAVADTPFAILAELIAPQPIRHRKRRRHKRPAVASPKAAT